MCHKNTEARAAGQKPSVFKVIGSEGILLCCADIVNLGRGG